MIAYNREDRKGGGIALVFKENQAKGGKNSRTYQYLIRSVVMDKLHLNILGLYHPPKFKVNKY